MKQIVAVLLLLVSISITAQTTVVTGPKKKQTTSSRSKSATSTRRTQTTTSIKEQSKSNTVTVSYDKSTNSIVFGSNRYKMIYVSGGTFYMGAPAEEESLALSDSKPIHKVTVDDFYIGQTEVTQPLWQAVMKENPSYPYWTGDNLPVNSVSWNDCQTFIEKLNSMTGHVFRLPTEAEWEFAARGGNNSRSYKYSGSNKIDDVAWYYVSGSPMGVHSVATKQANELGIYDMSGNVEEWCSDWYGSYSIVYQTNPTGATNGTNKVARGGNCLTDGIGLSVFNRHPHSPDGRDGGIGLRLILVR